MITLTDDRTLCCSTTCEKRFECGRSHYTNTGTHLVEDYSSFGSAAYTDSGCEIDHWCGRLGNYKMFEPIEKLNQISGRSDKKNTKVIAAFPACGKTYYFDRNEDYVILDSDSSKFSWMFRKRTKDELAEAKKEWDKTPHLLSGDMYINRIKDEEIKVRNPDFPNNYIEHIKENIGKADYIFVSTHEEVRKALTAARIDFALVFPERSLKAEWVGRCFLRGSGEKFCQLIADNWEYWLSQMEEEVVYNNRKHYRLKSNEYLSDALEHI